MTIQVPLDELLDKNRVLLDANLASKKSVLERAAELLAQGDLGVDQRDIFEALCQRERLGSTGLGHGVAIPHCRIGHGDVSATFVRLRKPVEFDSPDNQAVDLFFVLAVPAERNESHLKLLAAVAERFSDEQVRQDLRGAEGFRQITELLKGGPKPEPG
ncbi:MAG: PTS sugar transporter subunit IIA [Wenzhouxiangellaceae bacterium]